MSSKTLSQAGLAAIDAYLHMPAGKGTIAVPYFNNRRTKVRGGLRVNIGKGTATEIAEELAVLAQRAQFDLPACEPADAKAFLVDHGIGIDCSGLVCSVLDAELGARKKGSLKQHMAFPFAKNPLRKLLAKMRSRENTNVKTLAHNGNSSVVSLADVQPGDMITMVQESKGGLDHVLVIHQVDYDNDVPSALHYTHSFQWPEDGAHAHGVRQGMIKITDAKKQPLDQKWEEQDMTDEKNRTRGRAVDSDKLEIRRLNAFT